MVLNVPYYIQRRYTVLERLQMQNYKAKPDSKIRMTLTGSQVNALAHILENQTVLDRNAPLLMTLQGKLQIKQRQSWNR